LNSRPAKTLGKEANSVNFLKANALLLTLACFFLPPSHLFAAAPQQTAWSVALGETLMKRYEGNPQGEWAQWTYWKGYTLNGFEMLWRSTGDPRYLAFIQREIDPCIDKKGHLVNVDLKSLDSVMAGNIVIGLYEHTHDPRYRTAAIEIRKAIDTFPRNPDGGFWHSSQLKGEMWVDGVFMGQMFMLRYGTSIGDRKHCFDEAVRQILIFANHAQKGQTGLYYHAWAANPALATVLPGRTVQWENPASGLSPEVWSEGLGWYALVLVEALAKLPKDHPRRAEIQDVFIHLAAALKQTQDPESGGWFLIVDKPAQAGNWIDTSGTAMFTYAIERGIDLGLLDRSHYKPVVVNGYRAITANAIINKQGLVDIHSACDGLCVQASYSDYVNCTRSLNAKEAVAGFLWATTLFERDSGIVAPH
jgi:rhamnogalacturonyl hydrolase YesR